MEGTVPVPTTKDDMMTLLVFAFATTLVTALIAWAYDPAGTDDDR